MAAGIASDEDEEPFVADVIAAYREGCVKAERERVLSLLKTRVFDFRSKASDFAGPEMVIDVSELLFFIQEQRQP